MKKLTLLLTLVSFSAFGQIPNHGFEDWTEMDGFSDPDEWFTFNFFSVLAGDVITVEQGTPAPQGSSYLSMTTRTNELDTFPALAMTFFPYGQRPEMFTGQHKYVSAANDVAGGTVFLTRWDPVAQTQELVATATMELTGQQTNWSSFNVPFEYFSTAFPDTAMILLFSSMGEEQTPSNHLGLDDLGFAGAVGMESVESPLFQMYPVPAADKLTITADEIIREIQIFNTEGRRVTNSSVNALTTIQDISELKAGIYIARMIMQDGRTSQRPFIKQ